MKICEFCGKELDYEHAFCDEECENNTFTYYKKRKQFQTGFNAVSIICFAVIMLGTFIGKGIKTCLKTTRMISAAVLIVGAVCLALGIIVPF